jgi:hypothetical protein
MFDALDDPEVSAYIDKLASTSKMPGNTFQPVRKNV